jgi:hypothetical protein
MQVFDWYQSRREDGVSSIDLKIVDADDLIDHPAEVTTKICDILGMVPTQVKFERDAVPKDV